jgi:hypothetical protein
VIAGESTLTRWGQWWRIAYRVARLKHRVDALWRRVERLEGRALRDLAASDEALSKIRADFDAAMVRRRPVGEVFRVGHWSEEKIGGRSGAEVEYFAIIEDALKRADHLRSEGKCVVIETAHVMKFRRVS